ncbi:MAG: fibrillarin-like rRNA/tRNA 2'-O-methyltransferase [Thermoplasmata archaeon]
MPRDREVPAGRSPRLVERRFGDRVELWTETVGSLPPVYGERWKEFDGRPIRSFEPGRSKLAAGLAKGWRGPLPLPGERWLYLGAASGTTASHVADLVGPSGRVYAVERSVRPFARLLAVAQRWPNLFPILADAREPGSYADLVRLSDGLYADVAQPGQVEIVRANAALLLRGTGAAVVVALKTSSMGRERTAAGHLEHSEDELSEFVELAPPVRLDPFHKAHYLVGGVERALDRPSQPGGGFKRPPARSRGRP